MKQALLIMLDMQDAMNKKVNESWHEQGNAWFRAIWVECAELLDHYGWKWWKQQVPDIEQVNLELIDIWHFGLSILLEESIKNETSIEQVAEHIKSEFDNVYKYQDFKLAIEDFALNVLSSKSFDVRKFAGLLELAELSFDDLYSGYVGKNVLNFFRQDNGYKDGTYKKVWQGKEDNEHLVEALKELSQDSPTFKDDVYKALGARYRVACAG